MIVASNDRAEHVEYSIYHPELLSEFVGQSKLIPELIREVKAAITRNGALRSRFWTGPAGLGKTTLARILAKSRGSPVVEFSQGQAVTSRKLDNLFRARYDTGFDDSNRVSLCGYHHTYTGQLDANGHRQVVMTKQSSSTPTVVIFDEADGLSKGLHQSLQNVTRSGYPSGKLWYQSEGSENSYEVPDCTLIYLTNFADKAMKAGYANMERTEHYRFESYTDGEMQLITKGFAKGRKMQITEDAVSLLVKIGRGTPRYVIKLFDAVGDLIAADAYDKREAAKVITADMVKRTMDEKGMDYLGLTQQERQYLNAIYSASGNKFTMSLPVLTNILGYESQSVVTNTVEPDLMQMGLVITQGAGRTLTQKGVEYCRTISDQTGDGVNRPPMACKPY